MSIFTKKHRFIKNTYKGKGRPKKTDYEYKNMLEIQREIDAVFNKMIDSRIIARI
ncbi:hypothetical protein LCGC14_0434580 [marine sediment metagenome]|uniref:Uncharacterized protein n=1 Tax=marine sediment metagenome TaxID=412755 RepID=A0A0F9V8Y1_9ZZZZ